MSLPCPKCGTKDTAVTDTRMRVDEDGVPYIRRRRECRRCGERFSAVENREYDLGHYELNS